LATILGQFQLRAAGRKWNSMSDSSKHKKFGEYSVKMEYCSFTKLFWYNNYGNLPNYFRFSIVMFKNQLLLNKFNFLILIDITLQRNNPEDCKKVCIG
jgi:hypothetical protein